jgi:aspartate kinase
MEIKVAKFGGSSLADSEQFKKVGSIIRSDPARRYIVASAPGRSPQFDKKITDQLYTIVQLRTCDGNYIPLLNKIFNRYRSIKEQLGLTIDLDKEYQEILTQIQEGIGEDYIASRGEYLNAKLLAEYLGYDFVDAADCILFNARGIFDAEKTNAYLRQVLKKHEKAVLPGFYGSKPDDSIVTFSRGGSDITGAIVARATSAALYENWTDVSGVLMADPGCIQNPRTIELITYKELRELAYMGAAVLHDEAVFPVRYVGIPINIKNTNSPEDIGTMIVPNANGVLPQTVITGIAGKTGFTSITIEKDRMNSELGFGRRVLDAIEDVGMCFEHLPSGIDTMSVIVNAHLFKPHRAKIVSAIYRSTDPDSIIIEEHLALIAIVGRGMREQKGTATRIFAALQAANINIRLIDQGSSEINIIVGVEEKDFHDAIRAIYYEFVKE